MAEITVEIDIAEHLEEVPTSELLAELRSRNGKSRGPRYDGGIADADELREWAHRIELGQGAEVAREMFVTAFQRGAPVRLDPRNLPSFLRLARTDG